MAIWEFTEYSKEDLEKVKKSMSTIEKILGTSVFDEDMEKELDAELRKKEEEAF